METVTIEPEVMETGGWLETIRKEYKNADEVIVEYNPESYLRADKLLRRGVGEDAILFFDGVRITTLDAGGLGSSSQEYWDFVGMFNDLEVSSDIQEALGQSTTDNDIDDLNDVIKALNFPIFKFRKTDLNQEAVNVDETSDEPEETTESQGDNDKVKFAAAALMIIAGLYLWRK